jgi:hypothetical protein
MACNCGLTDWDAAMQNNESNAGRINKTLANVAFIALCFAGCKPGPAQYGETTDAFMGRVVQDGKPVTLPDESRLNLTHDKSYHRFGIPLKPDGSFEIGWMPIGEYSAELIWMREPTKDQGRYNVPKGLIIEKDTKRYEIELGKGWKR